MAKRSEETPAAFKERLVRLPDFTALSADDLARLQAILPAQERLAANGPTLIAGKPVGFDLLKSVEERIYRKLLTILEFNTAASEVERYSAPDTPQRWAKKYKHSTKTMVRWFATQKIRNKKHSDRSYSVHLDDLPDDER